MEEFIHDTGVTGTAPARRYLWTDAFAVCNLLGLHRSAQAPLLVGASYRDRALYLVHQVHRTLARHRDDSPRSGWLSGLPEEQGAAHPTAGGLRIGKPLPDRLPHEPVDPRLEWERDGQYFHYLTRWMHALLRVDEEAGVDGPHLEWAVELARVSHRYFLRGSSGARVGHLAWKMSVDLGRPVVESQGHHDPLDGYLTFRTLAARVRQTDPGGRRVLDGEIEALGALTWASAEHGWATPDPLGLGGLMVDLWRTVRLIGRGEPGLEPLIPVMLDAISTGLEDYLRPRPLNVPPEARLPFRELGLAIGLHALSRVARDRSYRAWVRGRIPDAPGLVRLGQELRATWIAELSRERSCWSDHRDINTVMLATALVPDGYLGA
jgi:hypothetical protein